jgi:hypothetical protein
VDPVTIHEFRTFYKTYVKLVKMLPDDAVVETLRLAPLASGLSTLYPYQQ